MHHLHMMGEAGALVVEKETRQRFYSIHSELVLSDLEPLLQIQKHVFMHADHQSYRRK